MKAWKNIEVVNDKDYLHQKDKTAIKNKPLIAEVSSNTLMEDEEHSNPLVSIVICIRNEEKNIGKLLHDLNLQENITHDKFEVIIIDDCSEDNSYKVASSFINDVTYHLRVYSLNVPDSFNGSFKKLGIIQGVEAARGEIIMVTDGDCRVCPEWVASVSSFFNGHCHLVFGPVQYTGEANGFEVMQSIEFAGLIGIAAATIHCNKPALGNGANMAFTKTAFNQASGFYNSLSIPSGDDEYLLKSIHQNHPDGVKFIKSQKAMVYTYAQPTLYHFYQQRKRWAGKWNKQQQMRNALITFSFFMFQSFWLAGVFFMFRSVTALMLLPGLYLLKAAADARIVYILHKFLQKPLRWKWFWVLELSYPIHTFILGVMVLMNKYEWKGRKFYHITPQ